MEALSDMVCAYCGGEVKAGGYVNHVECSAEWWRRANSGLCTSCGKVKVEGTGQCIMCSSDDGPTFRDYPGGE